MTPRKRLNRFWQFLRGRHPGAFDEDRDDPHVRLLQSGRNFKPHVVVLLFQPSPAGRIFSVEPLAADQDEARVCVAQANGDGVDEVLAGFEGIPSWKAEQQAGFDRYKAILARRTPDFQTARGYPVAGAGKANLSMSTNQLAERFGAVSMTLEMPFKDNADLPCAEQGWSPERSKQLGKDCLGALLEWLEG